MLIVLRTIVLLALLAALGAFVASIVTGDRRWRTRGLRLLRWTVLAALVFFGVLIAERLVEMLS